MNPRHQLDESVTCMRVSVMRICHLRVLLLCSYICVPSCNGAKCRRVEIHLLCACIPRCSCLSLAITYFFLLSLGFLCSSILRPKGVARFPRLLSARPSFLSADCCLNDCREVSAAAAAAVVAAARPALPLAAEAAAGRPVAARGLSPRRYRCLPVLLPADRCRSIASQPFIPPSRALVSINPLTTHRTDADLTKTRVVHDVTKVSNHNNSLQGHPDKYTYITHICPRNKTQPNQCKSVK